MCGKHRGRRRSARPSNHTRHRVDYILLFQPRVRDRLSHRNMRIGRPRPHEAQGALIHVLRHFDIDRTRNLRAKAVLGHILVKGDA